MIDFKTELKAQLETVGLPVYYELFCDSSTTTPCITYIENNNASYIEGNTIGYSTLCVDQALKEFLTMNFLITRNYK